MNFWLNCDKIDEFFSGVVLVSLCYDSGPMHQTTLTDNVAISDFDFCWYLKILSYATYTPTFISLILSFPPWGGGRITEFGLIFLKPKFIQTTVHTHSIFVATLRRISHLTHRSKLPNQWTYSNVPFLKCGNGLFLSQSSFLKVNFYWPAWSHIFTSVTTAKKMNLILVQ